MDNGLSQPDVTCRASDLDNGRCHVETDTLPFSKLTAYSVEKAVYCYKCTTVNAKIDGRHCAIDSFDFG